MSPIDFYLPALESDASVNTLVFNQFSDASLVYDFAIVSKVLLSDLSGMQFIINNDQFNPNDPSLNDIKLTISDDFMEGVFWNLFTDQSFNYDNGNVYPVEQYVKNILIASGNKKYIVDNWQELSVASLIDKAYGSYKYTVLFQNEDAIASSIPTQFNTALNNTLDTIYNDATDVNDNYLVESLGSNIQIFQSLGGILQKSLINDVGRFDNVLNDLSNPLSGPLITREFNEHIIKIGDTIQFLVKLSTSTAQSSLSIPNASFSNSPVIIKVVLEIVESGSDMITRSVRIY
jgi:hypothetical protein